MVGLGCHGYNGTAMHMWPCRVIILWCLSTLWTPDHNSVVGEMLSCHRPQRKHNVIITSLLRQNDVTASFWHNTAVIVRRAGLLWSQQDFEWRWSVPLFKCLTVLEFSFILFDLCLLITFFNFIMNYVPIVTFWIFTYHKIWILSIMFCFIWSYWIIYFLACL